MEEEEEERERLGDIEEAVKVWYEEGESGMLVK